MGISTPGSRRESRRERELANRRADAVEGATAVFAAKGFHDTQMTEIAAAAELSLASLYSMFKGKEELYEEVIRTTAGELRRSVRAAVESVSDPAERVLRLIDALFEGFEQRQDLMRILVSGTRGLPWRIREQLRGSRDVAGGFTSWVIELCRDVARAGYVGDLDPEALARSLIGAVAVTAAHAIDADPETPLTEAAPGVRRVFERVLLPAGES